MTSKLIKNQVVTIKFDGMPEQKLEIPEPYTARIVPFPTTQIKGRDEDSVTEYISDKLIYLASPYSSPHQCVIDQRVREVQDATARLIERGWRVFSPVVHSHPLADLVSFPAVNEPGAISPWMEQDLTVLRKADEFWVLQLTDWRSSGGIQIEHSEAEGLEMPIWYVSYPDLVITPEPTT